MDEKFLLLINREWTHPIADRLMALLSSFSAWTPVLIILLALMLYRGGFRTRAFIITAALAIGLNDGVLARSLKRLTDRPRPHQARSDIRIVDLAPATVRMVSVARPARVKLSRASREDVDGRSFPSAHTMNTCAAAVTAVAFFGSRAAWGFLVPVLVGYSRVYTGSHWPGDVLVSLVLGIGTTLLFLAAAEWLWRTFAPRFLPELSLRHPRLLAA